MGVDRKSRKVARSGRPAYGGDPNVDRDGISTENHQQLYRRLIEAGATMHSHPGPRKPKKS